MNAALPGSSPAPSARAKRKRNLLKLSRSPVLGRMAVVNHFNRTVAALAPTTKFPRGRAFLPSNIWPWICSYLRYVFERKCPFPDYKGSRKNGLYHVTPSAPSDTIRIGIAGDWATGTDDSYRIAGLIKDAKPDFTIHLGDVYYVGDAEEINQNCLGKSYHGYDGVTWPKGKQGSFALNGNHEMYANGKPYFTMFLTTLGKTGDSEGQLASFFCLETEHWRIIGIDTGYNSLGWPILGVIPVLKEIPFIGGDCRLEAKLIQWLRDVVQPNQNRKATVVLSHHQYFSAFPDLSYHRPANQLAEFFKAQEILWLWGHEHRLGIYDKFPVPGGITFYGRCIGHGGMPVEVAVPDRSKAPLELYDPRTHQLDDETEVGQNGFVNVSIRGAALTLNYRDIDNFSLFAETFTPNGDGTLKREVQDPGILRPPPS